MNDLLDITEICRLLGTTSRTLRYYEEKGIVQSTVAPFRTRRQYSPEQVAQIKQVLILRSLGLSVAKIREIQDGQGDLSSAIAEYKAELIASISAKAKEIRLLDEALHAIEAGGDIFDENETDSHSLEISSEILAIADECTDALVQREPERCYPHFTEHLCGYLPLSAFRLILDDTLKPLGRFEYRERMERDPDNPCIIYAFLRYQKLGLRIKYVFQSGQIGGIWLNYTERKGVLS